MNFLKRPIVNPARPLWYYFHVVGSFGSGIHGFKAQILSKSSKNLFDNSVSAATRKGLASANPFLVAHNCLRH